jgi:hypothetical protein
MGVLRVAPPVSVLLWDVHHNFWNEHHSHHQTTSGVITKMRNADSAFPRTNLAPTKKPLPVVIRSGSTLAPRQTRGHLVDSEELESLFSAQRCARAITPPSKAIVNDQRFPHDVLEQKEYDLWRQASMVEWGVPWGDLGLGFRPCHNVLGHLQFLTY